MDATLPKWANDALGRGDSVIINGQHIMPDETTSRHELYTQGSALAEMVKDRDARIVDLMDAGAAQATRIAELEAALEAKGKPGPKPKHERPEEPEKKEGE